MLFAAFAVSLAPLARAQPPPAGTPVANQAMSEYLEGIGWLWAYSNVVSTSVLPAYGIGLFPPGSVAAPAFTLVGASGDTLYCRFDVTNAGNAPDSVAVSYALVPSSTAIADLVFFRDADGSGTLGPGEEDRSFLALDAGGTTPMDVAVILPGGGFGGESFIEIRAQSTADALSPAEVSVIRVMNTDPPQITVFIGPRGNPRALPGGEGSGDDRTVGRLSVAQRSVAFENDVLNESSASDSFAIALADTAALPADVQVTFADSSGLPLTRAPGAPALCLVGMLGPGETRRIRVEVSRAAGPLGDVLDGPLDITVRAQSQSDSLQRNTTVDGILPPQAEGPDAALSIRQAFHEPSASVGDVVTLVVTAENITDSTRVEDVTVVEFVQPHLDFRSSPDFEMQNGELRWRVGTLGAGESRTGVIKFDVNGRVPSGTAKAFASVAGNTETGDAVRAGPAACAIRIETDAIAAEGLIFGEVFVDTDRDGVRATEEAGVPGVAVFIESGEYAVTDSLGRYTIPRVFEGYRVVRLDERTFPSDLEPWTAEGQGAESRGVERLVHILPGGHAAVSFPLLPRTSPLISVERGVTCRAETTIRKRARLYRAFAMPSSHFGVGKDELAVGAVDELRPVADFLFGHPGWAVLVEGHTDSRFIRNERFPSNVELSLARADAVRTAMVVLGVPPARIVIQGFGATRPVATNETIEGRRFNRRVDVSLIPPGVQFDGNDPLARVDAAIRDLGALPDTFDVLLSWELQTNATEPIGLSLRPDLPQDLRDADVRVFRGGQSVAPVEGTYAIADFDRRENVRCEVALAATAPDTAQFWDVRVTAEFSVPPEVEPTDRRARGAGLAAGGLASDGLASDGPEKRPGGKNQALSGPPSIVLEPERGDVRTDQTPTRAREILTWQSSEPSPSAGVTRTEGRRPRTGGLPPPGAPAGTTSAADTTRSPVERSLGILAPAEGEVFATADRIHVQTRVPVGARTDVSIAGESLGNRHVGKKSVEVAAGVEENVWYDVPIQPGWNTIMLTADCLDGTTFVDSVHVALASRAGSLEPQRARILVAADERQAATARFAVSDRLGLPVADGTVATVVSGDSIVADGDARPAAPGLQVTSYGGFFSLNLRPQSEPRRVALVVDCEGFRAATEVVYLAPSRPQFATGVVDLSLGVYDARGTGDPLGIDGFEDGGQADGEARLFAQRVLPYGWDLTARLDTRKRYEDPLLKEAETTRQYPIYGDASELHFAAPARGGNYVSLDRGESYVRYGDFRTPLTAGEFLAYHRAATGVTTSLVEDERQLKAFVTKTDFTTHRDEIPADGTSGFYYLSQPPIVENSERIFVEIRDRFRPEQVLELRPMIRERDYTINPFDGSILFKEPVDATDRDFNPVVVVVMYEVDSPDESRYLYGVRGDVKEGERYRAGAAAVANSGDGAQYALYGLDGELRWSAFAVGGEVARSEDEITGDGNAYRLETSWRDRRGEASAYLRRVDGTFNNPSFRGGSHELAAIKAGFSSRLKVSPAMAVEADGYLHELDRTGEEKSSVRAVVGFRNLLLELAAGLRAAHHDRASESNDGILSVLELGAAPHGGLRAKAQWEKNLTGEYVEDYPDRIRSSVAVPFGGGYKFAANYEYLTAPGRVGTHQLGAGVESRLSSSTTAYTRYAMDRTANDDRMGAVAGLRQDVRLRPELSGSLALEGFRSFAGGGQADDYLSVKTGLGTRRPQVFLCEGLYEYRWQEQRTRHVVQFAAGAQAHSGLAAVMRNVLSYSPVDDTPNELSYHGRIGLAYRPVGKPVTTLFTVKNAYERYSPVNPGAITWKLSVATDVNIALRTGHEVRVKLAHKRVEDWSYGAGLTSDADLVLTQYVYQFARVWDADVWGRVLSVHGGTAKTGAGVEIGRLFLKSLRISAGYSYAGLEDSDLGGTDLWRSGFGVRVQLIVSDWMLQELGGGRSDD